MTRATGSRLDLLSHCQAWAADSAVWSGSSAGEAARFGTAFHAVAAAVIAKGELTWGPVMESWVRDIAEQNTVDADDLVKMCHGWVNGWTTIGIKPDWEIATEVSFAWNSKSRTVRRADGTTREGRQLDPNEVVGTLDVVAWKDGRAVVIDHKTGSVVPAQGARQLLFGALVLSREAEQNGLLAPEIQVEFHAIAEDGTISIDMYTPDALDIAIFEDELLQNVAASNASKPNLGSHCADMYCPMLLNCPAARGAVAEALPVEDIIALAPASKVTEITTQAQLAKWLEIKPIAKRMMEEFDRQAKALVDSTPDRRFELPDGRTYRVVEYQRTEFSTAKAKELLGERAVECETSAIVTQYRVTGTADGHQKKTRRAKSHGEAAE